AEDIADFPDLNLSESIQRIPGVAITRDAGEGRQISVRGLGPQFTRVRINGMEALATGGGTDAAGGTNRARSFDFNVFASELFNSITVRKSASAEVEEGALGATVDLRTALPFDYDGFTMAASGQAHYNDLSESTDPRAAFLISNRWGNLGALFSVAYSDRESLEEGASTVRWQNGTGTGAGFGAENTPLTLAELNAAFRPRLPRYDVYQHEQERIGITGALQWAPTNATEITLSALYANFEGARTESFLQAPVFSATGGAGVGGVTVQDAEIDGNSIVYGVFDGVDIRSELRFDELRTEFTQLTLDVEHEISDRLTFRGMAGTAESDHANPIQTTLLFDADNITGYTYDYRGDNRLPLITYGATNLTSPATWHLEQIRLRPQTALNTYDTVQGELEFAATEVFTLSGGVNWRNYGFESTELRRSNGTLANQEGPGQLPGFTTITPIADYSMIMSLSGRGLSLPSGLPTQWLVPDINAAAALWDLYDTSVFPMGIEPALGNNFSVEEETLGGYAQLDWRSTEGRFRGNVGVRYVETEQTSTGYTFSAGVPVQSTVERRYDDVLPSLNLVAEPVDDLLFRFAAAEVISRPGLGFLSPGAAVTVSGANRTVTAGNPELEPTGATAYDLSIEWYFAEGALLSAAYFVRDIDTFVQTVREDRPFTGNPLGLPDSVATAACPGGVDTPGCNPGLDWAFNIPQNTPGGPVEGFEIGLQLPFFFLDGFWSNFGVLANYTQVESNIDYCVNAACTVTLHAPLVGLSEESYNATLYYEDDRFSARVSAAYRSDYPTTLPGRNGNATEETAETLNIDAAARYNINDNFAVTFEGVNLTDEVNDQFLTPDDRLSFYHHYGRSFFLGARYTY
ncbi:MAG TPA: TonB-dependent receptor, partial [Candidatus Binatia bacterium]|nr:TonB-dependent receptor [Candidatus Binatia bacterium]